MWGSISHERKPPWKEKKRKEEEGGEREGGRGCAYIASEEEQPLRQVGGSKASASLGFANSSQRGRVRQGPRAGAGKATRDGWASTPLGAREQGRGCASWISRVGVTGKLRLGLPDAKREWEPEKSFRLGSSDESPSGEKRVAARATKIRQRE
ncbi:hypothetical protein M5K25_015222 [Dendrobium thyrsiflorum]|uniref:Uncharacterized protein n=1 Tax=Dendrobium thyrsiflorum TaxID=117978 RepID=A0ABD0UPT1_DENTH